jgi:hypothetical protein
MSFVKGKWGVPHSVNTPKKTTIQCRNYVKQEMARFDFRCLTHDGKESSTKSSNLHLICVLVVSYE